MHIPSLYRIVALIVLICTAAVVHAGDGGGIVARAILDGSKHQLAKDSSVTVEDSAFYNASAIGVDTGYLVQNVITLKINEASKVYLRTAFTATVHLLISYSNGNDTASMEKAFTINYDTGHTYNARNSFVFYGGRKVTVKVLSIDTGSVAWNVSSVLLIENQLTARPKYNFSCSNTVTNITLNPSANANADELPVSWTAIRGADQYDLEWTYIDSSALANHKYGNPISPALVFFQNATRISTTGNSYNIPLMYENSGTLFIRVRPVQLGAAKSVLNAIWSSDASPTVMAQYDFKGHERPLNWQSSINFAEEGKRKVVVQYLDGSLRSRQTVTKDNTTNNTIVAETYYDYQGRPAIQVMPAPSLKNVIQYTAGFNVSINNSEYTQRFYDSLGSADTYCGIHAGAMSSDSGASLYYSPKNPNKTIGVNQFIPDAENYPFTETEYTQDNTGRISRQGGVGADFQLGSGHETKYYYGTPDQSELDALFGTDVGDYSHYFKNMVRDANGQYSVSYADMHGRTIATALAGGAPDHMAALPSNVQRMIKENLADSNSMYLQDWSIANQKSLLVAQTDSFDFHYRLDPSLVSELNCADSSICYTCLYDLQITITDDCNNQLLPGAKAFDTVVHNFSFGHIDNTCNPTPLELNFKLQLQEGSYQVTKQLTINRDAYLYYRDSIYMPNNTCKSMQDFIQEQRDLIAQANTDCVPDCKSCRDSVGTFEQFRNKFITKAGITVADTADFRTQIETAYTDAIHACDILCGDSTSDDNDIRNAMLQDMTPPYGQYADTTLKNRDKYSIFYVDPQDSVGYVPVYRLDDVHYTNDAGQPDQVYDMQSDLMVDPGSLGASDFTQLFRNSWAEALLPYHPEYCKLKKLESLHPSNVWNRQMEAIDNFSDAEKAGYLNPTGNGKYKYHSVSANVDPFTQDATQKTKLETRLDTYLTIGNGVNVSMWGMATAMAKCDSGNAQCIQYYSNSAATKNNAFDTTQMCEGDLDMAWRFFRQLYLSYKKDLENAFVNDSKGCTPLNQALDKVPTYAILYDDGHTPRFNEDTKTTADKNDLSYILQGTKDAGSTNAAKNRAQDSLNSFYVQNSEALAIQWAAQLSPCQYPDAEIQNTILPLLKGLCKAASDADHPFGASSLPAGRDYMGYHSFVEILTAYNRQHGITNNSSCNPYMITTPVPYDKQPVYSAKPVYVKPSECECQIITDRFNAYLLSGGVDGSFSAYMQRTQGVTMSNADLLQLRQLCKKGMVSTDAGFDCQYLTRPILLPPAFQCNSGESCTSCTVVNELYKSYKEQFPNDTPGIGEADDTVQLKRNTLFKNYMNTNLGYSLEAWQYLQFIGQCADSSAYTHEVKCVDGHIGNLYRTISLAAGKLYDIQPTPDGGYIMAGSILGTSRQGSLVKTDSLGAQIWAMQYGGSASDTLLRVRRTADNGYIAIGTTHSGHYGTGAMWIIKTDNSGRLTWTKSIGFNTPFGEHGYDIIQTSDGGYAALGLYNRHAGHGEFLLSRIQSDGTISWVHRFGTSRLQNNSTVCIPGETDSISYDGVPSYGLLEQDDTLLVSGAAYDPNLGDRYFGVVHKISKANGKLLGSWHYADGADTTRSCWFRDIYPTENGYMIMVNSAQKLGTVNAQVGVIQLTKTGDVASYKRFDIPAGSNRMATSSVFPSADGGYMVAQTGNNSTHVIWQKVDATGTLTGSTETSLSGTQSIGRIAQNTSGLFTMAGNSDQDMLMLVLRPGLSCFDNPVTLGATEETATRVPWAIGVDEYVMPQYTDDDLKENTSYVLTDSALTCPGAGHCYDIYTGPQLCGKSTPLMPPTEVEYTGTCTDSSFFAVSKGTEYYKVYSDSLTGAFEQTYINKCLEAYRYESFTVTHPKREYHYTLYYYDQAGNLVRTVPPAGVQEIIDTNVLKQVVIARAAHIELVPAHTLVTDYRYNTLNKLVAQHTPDGGVNSFWYDRLGRMCVSQNAKQKDSTQYSYTKYDELSRITEMGQLTSSAVMADATSRNEGSLNAWLINASGTAEQITRSVYDQEYTPIRPYLAAINLRNRVSRIGLYNTALELSRDSAAASTYYSYDILGNVDSLLQDYRSGVMGDNANRFKKIAYEFDLISGKVNQVIYQPGRRDAFYHRYIYDAENRVTNVLTSLDSINWDNDAYYQYYDHGFLARTVLGEQQVQGINYAYNLQGWIKTINPEIYTNLGYNLKADGSSGSVVGKTAYNVMLNYFNGDYKAISGATPQDAGIDAALGNAYRPLFNGNISSMAVNVGALNNPLLYNYQFDQLNRLVVMDAWKKTGNAWSNLSPINDFGERVSYDGNGNILSYNRNGNTAIGKPLEMDKLAYNYRIETNQLDYIYDTVPAGNYDTDIDAQSVGNYAYDPVGNLIKDNAEGITSIDWTVYGKIARIAKDDGTVITYTYGPDGKRISKTVVKTASATTETTWYVRDGHGNVLSVYESGKTSINNGHLTQSELHVYGSSRVGLLRRSLDVAYQAGSNADPTKISMPLLGIGDSLTFIRGDKLYELGNHLDNVMVIVNDKKLGISSNNNTVDYFNPQVVSAQDYYPFGMLQPGRNLNVEGYRYGFDGQERSDDIKGKGNSYTAEYWEYDPRLGRRFNADPIDLHIQSVYATFNNNPLYYVDPTGLYSSEGKAEKMRRRAIRAGKNVGDVTYRASKNDWVFTETRVELERDDNGNDNAVSYSTIHSSDRYFGGFWQNTKDLVRDLNPIRKAEGYFGAVIKTEIIVNENVKIVAPIGGFQLMVEAKNGKITPDAKFVNGTQSYLNVKAGNLDVRLMPLNGIGGDYKPGLRALYTMAGKPIIIPVGDVPVPVGEWKVQADVATDLNKLTVGARGVVESLPFPTFEKGKGGIKLELNAGMRFDLKWPDIITD